jgi:hypothetical protein
MYKLTGLGPLVATIGVAIIVASSFAHGQVDGAVQYPPASIGKDAQPPPPAGMVPQSVSPRRIELGVSGSSTPPAIYRSRSPLWTGTDRFPMQAPPSRGGLSPEPFSSAVGN